MNERAENIGARRLYTILERVLEEVSFQALDLSGKTVTVDAGFVHGRLADAIRDDDVSRYICEGGGRELVTSAMEKLIEKAGHAHGRAALHPGVLGKDPRHQVRGPRHGVPQLAEASHAMSSS